MHTITRKQWAQLKARAEAGDAEAQWHLGDCLGDGIPHLNVRPDARAAVRWLRRSAMGGDAAGQCNYGVRLSDGRGIRRNSAEALLWYKRALRQGLGVENNIACEYRDRGDHRRAFFWYQRAVAGGDYDALVDVGRGYSTGVGVRRDPEQAVRCFRKAIARTARKDITEWGREEAMIHLGTAYHEGRGVKQSNAQAMKWLSLANKDDDHDNARKLMQRITGGGG